MPSFISSDVAEDMILLAKQFFDQNKKKRYFNSGNQQPIFHQNINCIQLIATFTKTGLVKCKKGECIKYSTNGAGGQTLELSAYTSSLSLKSDFNLPK